MQKADGNIEGDKREVTIEDIAVFIELKARALIILCLAMSILM